MSSTAYIAALEAKVRELESLHGTDAVSASSRATTSHSSEVDTHSASSPPESKRLLQTMVKAHAQDDTGQVEGSDDDDQGESFGGLSLLQRLHVLCEKARKKHSNHSMYGDDRRSMRDGDLKTAFDVAPPESPCGFSWEAFAILPSRNRISSAIDCMLSLACCDLTFLDRTTLHNLADEAYQEAESGFTKQSRKSLSLLFAVLALAQRFDQTQPVRADTTEPQGIYNARYFRASRALLDPSDCQDLVSLSTLQCIVIYTQSCSMLSISYSYVCMAVASALQMGLVNSKVHGLPAEQLSWAKQLMRVLFITDAYTAASLGLPRTLRDIDMDRVVPATSGGHFDSETEAHVQLARVLAEIVERNHPPCKVIPQRHGFYSVPYSNVAEAEHKLSTWFACMEASFPVTAVCDLSQLRAQLMLRYYHAHAQLVLYRPFMHHALHPAPRNDEMGIKAYSCGSACIKSSMQITWLLEKMEENGVLNLAHWYLSLIVAHAAACLVLFATGASHQVPTTSETADAVERLRDLCARHATGDQSIRQCHAFLEIYFPKHPSPKSQIEIAELQARFEPNLSHFSNAFDHSFSGDGSSDNPMDADDESLQALSIPGFQSFMSSTF